MRQATSAQWAFEEFGRSTIADPRWARRLVQMARQAAHRPAGRVTEVFTDDAQRQGAYGLLESAAVAPDAVAEGMFVACARRAAGDSFVFCPVDGTSLTLADHGRAKDFGSVGARYKGARGLKVINALMLSSQGVPIGISGQQWWTRSASRRKKHHHLVAAEQKETNRWLKVMEQTRATMAEHAPQVRCWFQLDREGDCWPVLVQAGAADHWFTIRSSWNRRVIDADGKASYLRALLRSQRVSTTYALPVRASAKRRPRVANMAIRACTVTLKLTDKRTGKRWPLTVNVVSATEQGTTPAGEKPIEWTLLTNRPIETTEQMKQVVLGYSMRWRIEELHRTWKSGCCDVEESQLRTANAMIKWATILIAVAVRVERIKQLARQEPDRPASEEFTPVELQAIVLLRFGRDGKGRPHKGVIPTMAEATLWLAQIGGYVAANRSSGPPGSITISRGLRDVRAAARALAALPAVQ